MIGGSFNGKHGSATPEYSPRNENCFDNCLIDTFFRTLKYELNYEYQIKCKSILDCPETVQEDINYGNIQGMQKKKMPPNLGKHHAMYPIPIEIGPKC